MKNSKKKRNMYISFIHIPSNIHIPSSYGYFIVWADLLRYPHFFARKEDDKFEFELAPRANLTSSSRNAMFSGKQGIFVSIH